LVFYSSVIKMMHGPINISFAPVVCYHRHSYFLVSV